MKKILPLLALLLMACGSTPAHQTTSDASSVEEAAVSHLYYVLNSDSGHVMTASELAHQKSGNGIFKIDLPIDKSNELPLFETIYIDDVTGSRIVYWYCRLSDGYTRLAEASARHNHQLSRACPRQWPLYLL